MCEGVLAADGLADGVRARVQRVVKAFARGKKRYLPSSHAELLDQIKGVRLPVARMPPSRYVSTLLCLLHAATKSAVLAGARGRSSGGSAFPDHLKHLITAHSNFLRDAHGAGAALAAVGCSAAPPDGLRD